MWGPGGRCGSPNSVPRKQERSGQEDDCHDSGRLVASWISENTAMGRLARARQGPRAAPRAWGCSGQEVCVPRPEAMAGQTLLTALSPLCPPVGAQPSRQAGARVASQPTARRA